MTLLDMIGTLSGEIEVTVKDGENVLIQFISNGINSVSDEVTSRTVSEWDITGSTRIEVVLA